MADTSELHTITIFSGFFEQNKEKFLSFAYSYIRNRADAEDLLMESMTALWENRDKWQEGANLHGLLLTIIKNKALTIWPMNKYVYARKKTSTFTNSVNWNCVFPH